MKIIAYTENRLPESLSNFVYNVGGYEEGKRYITALIESAGFNAGNIAFALNHDYNILDTWSVFTDTEAKIVVEGIDVWDNKHYIRITP